MIWECNEHDEFELVVAFYTSAGVLSAPSSISYRIDTADGEEIRDDTSVSAASSVTITIGYEDNAIVDDTAEYEDHVLTVTGVFGTADGNPRQVSKQFRWQVKNLQQVP